MNVLYENDYQTLYINDDGDFIMWYHGGDQKEHEIVLGSTPGEVISELQGMYEDNLIKYITQNLNKMTFEEFIEDCCVPDDYEWAGTSEGIVEIKKNYGIATIDITDDPEFEIKAEIDEGIIVNWGNDDIIITDDIYQEAYIVVEILEDRPNYPFRAKPADTDFYYHIQDAENKMKEYLEDEQ